MSASPSHAERLSRARISLEGLSVGDAFGSSFEFLDLAAYTFPHELREGLNLIQARRVSPKQIGRWTDDTNMALSIYRILRLHGEIKQNELAEDFAQRLDENRGYAGGAIELLSNILEGGSWHVYAPQLFDGTGSFGNGGAMRVAPLGAYFADDLDKAAEQARLSAEITHAHPEGIAGTIAVAVGAALVWGAKQNGTRPTRPDLLDSILPYVPEGEVRRGIQIARDLPLDTTTAQAAQILGNGGRVSAQDTVPFVLWACGEYVDNYEEALWQTVSALGDADTTCAMVGGMVALYTGIEGIPQEWRKHREALPEWAFEDEV